jgi:uncharacterized protein (DUF2147 family)|tara:strand:- start:1065 stop:1511 length:447 start_codon:yes stop_codon:yes gene_type:complete
MLTRFKEILEERIMRKILAAVIVFFIVSVNVFAEPFSGVYKTMPSKTTGGWAHVKFGACKENKNFTCGTLIKAFSRDGKAVKNYEHQGKYVVWDMRKEGDKDFSGGKIKDYSDGKVYNSKMEILSKNKIGVSGCVLFICQAQEWSKVK